MFELPEIIDRWNSLLGPNPYLRAALTVIGFVVIAKVAEWLLRLILRPLRGREGSAWLRLALEHLPRPVFITVTLFGLMVATTIVLPEGRAESIVLAALKTILVVVWVSFGVRTSEYALSTLSHRVPPPPFVQPATAPLLRIVLMLVAFMVAAYAILLAWDVNITGLVASAGIIGLAVSFAAQDTLGNIVAGISILADKPYKLGDYIVLDTGERGRVIDVGLRSTRLLTRDDVEVSIPNGVIGKAKIVNESGGPEVNYRLRIPVGVAYGSDVDQVVEVLLAQAQGHEQVCGDPEPRVRFRSFGESSLDFELLAWIEDPAQRGLVVHELNCRIYKAFTAADIRIPFPQRDVHILDMPVPDAKTG